VTNSWEGRKNEFYGEIGKSGTERQGVFNLEGWNSGTEAGDSFSSFSSFCRNRVVVFSSVPEFQIK
jgi:hypothetical protein